MKKRSAQQRELVRQIWTAETSDSRNASLARLTNFRAENLSPTDGMISSPQARQVSSSEAKRKENFAKMPPEMRGRYIKMRGFSEERRSLANELRESISAEARTIALGKIESLQLGYCPARKPGSREMSPTHQQMRINMLALRTRLLDVTLEKRSDLLADFSEQRRVLANALRSGGLSAEQREGVSVLDNK